MSAVAPLMPVLGAIRLREGRNLKVNEAKPREFGGGGGAGIVVAAVVAAGNRW
jgi:hypothetical protein